MTGSVSEYQLIDFGGGRKLERIGDWTMVRDCPAAGGVRPNRRWDPPDARFDAASRRWVVRRGLPAETLIDCGPFSMPVSMRPFGHIGVFVEQRGNWRWLSHQPLAGTDALNLFGYTGASSIAMAMAGAAVVHVDAAKPNVAAARAAAAVNGLAEHPIRYMVDDAAKFVAREIRRGRRYQTVVLDPPAYGHPPKGRAWRIERDLWPLLSDCCRLLDDDGRMLVTGHTEGIGAAEVRAFLDGQIAGCRFEGGRMTVPAGGGRRLDAGFFLRCRRGEH